MTLIKCIEFKNASGLHIAQVLANKGIYFQVRDDAGEEYAVPKKQVVRGPWEEEELTEEEEELEAAAANHSCSLSQALAQVQATDATPKVKKEKPALAERDPNLVSLKQLCFDLKIEPRVARRRLRKAVGHVGIGGRWEWMKDSPEFAAVQTALTTEVKQDTDDAAE